MMKKAIENEIMFWKEWASQNKNSRYDIALFKIWIQFERFIGELFIKYSIGEKSEEGYSPQLKLDFSSEEQLNAFLREGNKPYIEYLNKINKLSKHIFETDPFQMIYKDSKNSLVFDQVKAIRNYVAHESGSAKSKYINICFSGDKRKFKEPNDYLKQREKETGESYFTYYTDAIKDMVELLINPPDDL